MPNKVFLITDMVDGFCKYGVFANPAQLALWPEIDRVAKIFDEEGEQIDVIEEGHEKGSTEFLTYPEHCVIGSGEENTIEELQWIYTTKGATVVRVRKNSTCVGTTGKYWELIPQGTAVAVVAGGTTCICAFQTALWAKKQSDEYNQPVRVVIVKNLVATYDAPGHPREHWENIVWEMCALNGIEVVDTYEDIDFDK